MISNPGRFAQVAACWAVDEITATRVGFTFSWPVDLPVTRTPARNPTCSRPLPKRTTFFPPISPFPPATLPRVVVYGADELSERGRRFIEESCGVPVFSAYQAIEAFKIAFECAQHRGMHLNIDLYPVRIIDQAGGELPMGAAGEVILSNLVNRATVLLNYRLGDIAHVLPEPCPCGSSLPLLSFLDGRSDDWLRLPSGRALHSQAIRTVFTPEEEIWQYQVVQEGPTFVRVSLVVADECERESTRRRIGAKLADVLGTGMRIEIGFAREVERTSGGKVRPVISHCQGHEQLFLARDPTRVDHDE